MHIFSAISWLVQVSHSSKGVSYMPIDEFLTVTVRCRTAIEVLLLSLSLCLIVMFDILSFSLKSIPFLINIHLDVMMMMSTVY